MAYILPDSVGIFCVGTGLSPTHPHTFRFQNREEQYNFFASREEFRVENLSYIRIGNNRLKVQAHQWAHRRCDYLIIQNRKMNRYIYAFITDSYYVNETTTMYTFEIDFIQTYFYEMFIQTPVPYMYIERETVDVDAIYGNTVPEPVSLGREYVYRNLKWSNINVKPTFQEDVKEGSATGVFGGWLPVITRPKNDPANLDFISGICTPLSQRAFKTYKSDVGSTSSLYDYLAALQPEDFQEFVDFCMYPEALVRTSQSFEPKIITEEVTLPGKGLNPWKDEDFTPRNNKLYTAPFCMITVSNGCGQAIDYAPQYFKEGLAKAVFHITGTSPPNPEFYCAPTNYGGTDAELPAYTVTLSGVPKVPIVTDAYKIYMSQSAASRAFTNLQSKVQGFEGLKNMAVADIMGGFVGYKGATTGDFSGLNSAISQSASGYAQYQNAAFTQMHQQAQVLDAQHLAKSTSSGTAPNAMYIQGNFGFSGYITKIDVEYAKMADNYFTMYGYAINDMKRPNIFSRKNWNYLKGRFIQMNGLVSSLAKLQIENAVANGITFWNPEIEIGSYNLTNPRNI